MATAIAARIVVIKVKAAFSWILCHYRPVKPEQNQLATRVWLVFVVISLHGA